MNDKKSIKSSISDMAATFMENYRQYRQPEEFRIQAPEAYMSDLERNDMEADKPAPDPPETPPDEAPARDMVMLSKMALELSNCLWYLKTKYFKRNWDDHNNDDDEPKTRRALNQLNNSIDSLKTNGIEVFDPTGTRYPPGGEGMMRPIQFQPTSGLTFEMVTETIAPVIYLAERLVQRGEVFVAVPLEEHPADSEPMPQRSFGENSGVGDPAGQRGKTGGPVEKEGIQAGEVDPDNEKKEFSGHQHHVDDEQASTGRESNDGNGKGGRSDSKNKD
ncbi:MAG: hypothetical protein C4530_03875 [Desulfobacteraceae bacterium]|nr:MAG: hypothetical protein C4530_03875 [Desulfobacteraceae bacterium]